jgi:flagellar protein FliJ
MKNRSTITLLIDLAQERSDSVLKKLALVRKNADEAQQRLRLLQDYRGDYEKRFGATAAQGIVLDQLRNFHAFLAKLELAIQQQTAQAAQCAGRVKTVEQEWQAEQRRMKSFAVLKDRMDAAAAARELKKLQNELDEFAARRMGAGARN